MRRWLLSLPLFLFAPAAALAQVGERIDLGNTCSYFGEGLPANVTTFSSNQEAEGVIGRIVGASGLSQNFQIRAAGVPNAAAVIQGTTRYILYNTAFIRNVRESTGSEWAPTSIMAHEIGHHLNGHTLDQLGSRPNLELEADYFSGFILQKLGGSLNDAQVAMQRLGDPTGSSTHPPRHDRLEAIASGWTKSCDADANCRPGTTTRRPRTAPEKEPEVAGPDSCEYAGDGECDEPGICDSGTDTTDCRISTRRRDRDPINIPTPPQMQVATVCVTPAGACGMMVPIPVGSICTCYTPVGVFQGMAR